MVGKTKENALVKIQTLKAENKNLREVVTCFVQISAPEATVMVLRNRSDRRHVCFSYLNFRVQVNFSSFPCHFPLEGDRKPVEQSRASVLNSPFETAGRKILFRTLSLLAEITVNFTYLIYQNR